jgi:pimeloyl-ACP methyl ester carboxylesterase
VITEHDTKVRGSKIHWLEAGSGDDPFLLIHGFGSSVAKWLDVLPLLGAERRAIALDLPGFGASDAPFGPYSPAWLAGAVLAFCDEIGVSRGIWTGNSLGGLIAIHAAASKPDRVAALIGVDAALPTETVGRPSARVLAGFIAPALPVVGEQIYRRYFSRPPELIVQEGLERNCAHPERITEKTRAALIADAASRLDRPEHARAVVRANRQMLWALSARREQIWRIVESIHVPTLFIWGERDRLISVDAGEQAVRRLPGSELVVIDCGHNPQMECPEEFSSAAIAFARRAGARAEP